MKMHRRRFLVGAAGAAVVLPVLEAWTSERALADGAATGGVVFVRAGNGVAQRVASSVDPLLTESFWQRARAPGSRPLGLADYAATGRATGELFEHASHVSFVRGMATPGEQIQNSHNDSMVRFMTGREAIQAEYPPLADPLAGEEHVHAAGPTADWELAAQINASSSAPLSMIASNRGYNPNLSWSAARMRAGARSDPRVTFNALLGSVPPADEAGMRRAGRRQSINDILRGEISTLIASPSIGSRDRERLQVHFDAIRDLQVGAACSPDGVGGIDGPYEDELAKARAFMDVVAFAFSCGIQRVATIQVGDGHDNNEYMADGARMQPSHWISHRADDTSHAEIPGAWTKIHRIDRLHLATFNHLLRALASYPSIGGTTLLDQSVAVWFNDHALGSPHFTSDIPIIVGGQAGGALQSGVEVDYLGAPGDGGRDRWGAMALTRLHHTIFQAMGVTPSAAFGEPGYRTDPLAELLAG